MKFIAAYLLAVLGGNENPNAENLNKILNSVGIQTDNEKVEKLLKELNGKNVYDVISTGLQKLTTVPTTGISTTTTSNSSSSSKESKVEEKKEEKKKEEPKEESDEVNFFFFY